MPRLLLMLGALFGSTAAAASELPNTRSLWDFGDPAASEQAFVEAAADPAGDRWPRASRRPRRRGSPGPTPP